MMLDLKVVPNRSGSSGRQTVTGGGTLRGGQTPGSGPVPTQGSKLAWGGALLAVVFLAGVAGCQGGAEIRFEGKNAVFGSPFPSTILIPARYGGDKAYVQTVSLPVLGAFVLHLDTIPPPVRSEFFNMSGILQGLPDSLVLEEDRDLAFVPTSGKVEGVFVFNPAQAFTYLTSVTYTGSLIGLDVPLPDSEGNLVSQIRPVFTSGAALLQSKVYISTSNFTRTGSNPICAPGTVLITGFETDQNPPSLFPVPGRQVIFTTGFNPTEVTPFAFQASTGTFSESYQVLLVTNTGVLAIRDGNGAPLTAASVDVVDTEHDCVVASYPLGLAGLSFSKIVVARQKIEAGEAAQPIYRGYLGSAAFSQIYELDLTGLEDFLLTGPPGSVPCPDIAGDRLLSEKVLASPSAPILASGQPAPTPNYIYQVVVNPANTKAYATGCDSGTLAVLGVGSRTRYDPVRGRYLPLASTKNPEKLIQVTDPMPSLNATSPGPVAVRPGVPGADYQGADVYVVVGSPMGELRPVTTY